jgi:DNA polymerase theta
MDDKELSSMVEASLEELKASDLLEVTADETFAPTRLGQAIVASAFSPEDGLFIHGELQRALKSFVMDGEMHMFYTFAPLQTLTATDVDWCAFRDELYQLDESGIRAMHLVGVKPGHINNLYDFPARPSLSTLSSIDGRPSFDGVDWGIALTSILSALGRREARLPRNQRLRYTAVHLRLCSSGIFVTRFRYQ